MAHTQDLIIIHNFYLKGFSTWYRFDWSSRCVKSLNIKR